MDSNKHLEIAVNEVAESFERLLTHREVAAAVFSDPNMTPHDMLRGAMAFQLAVLERPASLGPADLSARPSGCPPKRALGSTTLRSCVGSEGRFDCLCGLDDATHCRMMQVGVFRDSAVGPFVLEFAPQHIGHHCLRSFGEFSVANGVGGTFPVRTVIDSRFLHADFVVVLLDLTTPLCRTSWNRKVRMCADSRKHGDAITTAVLPCVHLTSPDAQAIYSTVISIVPASLHACFSTVPARSNFITTVVPETCSTLAIPRVPSTVAVTRSGCCFAIIGTTLSMKSSRNLDRVIFVLQSDVIES